MLTYSDRRVGPSGGEIPPGSDVVKCCKTSFISPKGYFTVQEVLHIALHRYTGKNAKKCGVGREGILMPSWDPHRRKVAGGAPPVKQG